MSFGNLGFSGILLIVVVLLLFFGPSKLPEIGKAFGKSLREFRQATKGLAEDGDDVPPGARESTVERAETSDRQE